MKQRIALGEEISLLRDALMDLTGVLNRPQPDAALMTLAGVDLDRALFPLLVRVGRRGPLGIGELAELCGRDYTTVSRQVTKLEGLGLVTRKPSPHDARIKEVLLTEKGLTMTEDLDAARERIFTSLLEQWNKEEVAHMARYLRRLADDAQKFVRLQKSTGG